MIGKAMSEWFSSRTISMVNTPAYYRHHLIRTENFKKECFFCHHSQTIEYALANLDSTPFNELDCPNLIGIPVTKDLKLLYKAYQLWEKNPCGLSFQDYVKKTNI